ncbi:MAG: alpha-N-acetylglucosaminidase TIM-barrel domain-containing protein [Planctomycetota bacterium]
MTLNGINAPLAVTGQEAVWQAVGQRLGLADEQIDAFFAGAPYLPFGWMGCLDGWARPLPQSWIDRHETLQKMVENRPSGLSPFPFPRQGRNNRPARRNSSIENR